MQFTRVVAPLGAALGALVLLAGCAGRGGVPAGEGVLLVSWLPPTKNTDGTPLMDLASYQIYFDTVGAPCRGGSSIKVSAAEVGRTRDGRVAVILTKLVVGQIYHVAVTAVNVPGAASDCSNSANAPARPRDEK
jgi:hypothetical protein